MKKNEAKTLKMNRYFFEEEIKNQHKYLFGEYQNTEKKSQTKN